MLHDVSAVLFLLNAPPALLTVGPSTGPSSPLETSGAVAMGVSRTAAPNLTALVGGGGGEEEAAAEQETVNGFWEWFGSLFDSMQSRAAVPTGGSGPSPWDWPE